VSQTYTVAQLLGWPTYCLRVRYALGRDLCMLCQRSFMLSISNHHWPPLTARSGTNVAHRGRVGSPEAVWTRGPFLYRRQRACPALEGLSSTVVRAANGPASMVQWIA
jgi:hypothetical protein